MMLGSLGYSFSPTPPYFTPDPQVWITITPTNGAVPFQTLSTESYLQSNLVGQMQNSGQYVGWTQAQWIAALTTDAQQRCAFFPGSCGNSTPEALGAKYGALAYQIMQQKQSQTIYAPPPDNTLNNVAPTPSQPPVTQPPTQVLTSPSGPRGTVAIKDLQTGATQLMTAGDPFVLQITGAAPNAPVSVAVGSNFSQSQGMTDANGNFQLMGTVPNSPGTTQSQAWTVGGVPVTPSALQFAIVAAPTPAGSNAGSGSGTSQNTNANTDLSSATDWLTANWPLLAAGVAALVILPGLLGGRR